MSTQPISKPEYDAKWIARVRAKAAVDANGCWVWPYLNREKWGYGQTNYRNRTVTVHRQMYKLARGVELTKQQYVCHSCDNTACCNPDHLWIGSNQDNMQDCSEKGRADGQWKTHCDRGHPLSGDNVYWAKRHDHPTLKLRHCKTCARIRQRIKAGWSVAEAESTPAIPANARSKRRWNKAA
jgi:hypothetical protein